MSELKSFPFYTDDWFGSKARATMSELERLTYLELLFRCWIDGSLPADERRLVTLSGLTPGMFRKRWARIQQEFSLREDGWHHAKVDEKRPGLLRWREGLGKGGKAAAQARAQADAKENAQASNKPTLERQLKSTLKRTLEQAPSPSPTPTTKSSGGCEGVMERASAPPPPVARPLPPDCEDRLIRLAAQAPNRQSEQAGLKAAAGVVATAVNPAATLDQLERGVLGWYAAMREGRARTKALLYIVQDGDWLREPPAARQRGLERVDPMELVNRGIAYSEERAKRG